MLLYIIRHGDPDYTTDSLTEKGVLQAEAVGKRLFHSGIHRIFSSPMGRAKQTAEPACRLLGKECVIEPWAHEIGKKMYVDFPDGRYKPLGMVQNTYFFENGNVDIPREKYMEVPGFNESRINEPFKRIWDGGKDFLERLGYKEENGVYRIIQPTDEKVALFCHAAFAKGWLTQLLHIPPHIMYGGFSYTHTGVTILEFRNNKNGLTFPQCLCYSDTSHLYAEGLELMYNNHIPY